MSMQVTREDLNPCTVQLTVICGDEEVREGFGRAYRDLAKKVRVPGFRPGQAPRAVVEKLVAKEDLYDVAAEHIVKSAFRRALEQESLEIHSQPSVELKRLDEAGAECEFVAKVPLPPQIELADYTSLSAERPVVEVSEAEVDRQIDELRKERSTRETITDRGVQEGDVAVVNLKIETEESEGRNFMLVAGQTFPELDAALLGMKVEEMKSVELTFPMKFQEKDWAEKTLSCQVTLRSLSAVKLPELDSTFAQAYKTSTVDDLKALVETGVLSAKNAMAEEYVTEQLLEQLLQKSTIHIPDTMWEQVASRRLQDLAEEQRKKGKSLEDYAAEQGMTTDQLVEAMRHEALVHVKRAVIVQEIFRRETLTVSNDEMSRELIGMSREFGIEPQELLNQLKKNDAMEELTYRAINHKVAEFLRTQASVTHVRMDD